LNKPNDLLRIYRLRLVNNQQGKLIKWWFILFSDAHWIVSANLADLNPTKKAGRGVHARQSKETTSYAPAWGGQAACCIAGGVTPVHTSKGGGQMPRL